MISTCNRCISVCAIVVGYVVLGCCSPFIKTAANNLVTFYTSYIWKNNMKCDQKRKKFLPLSQQYESDQLDFELVLTIYSVLSLLF